MPQGHEARTLDKKLWVPFVKNHIRNDPEAIECFAWCLAFTREAIELGPEGVMETIDSLTCGIEKAYLRTEAHRAALKLYTLSLLGYLRPQDEPLKLLNDAIARGEAEVQRTRQFQAASERRSTKRRRGRTVGTPKTRTAQ